MRIIVAQEEHSTRYMDASTDETWAQSALALLTERWNDGYWYNDPSENVGPVPMTRAEIDVITDPTLKFKAEAMNKDRQDRHLRAQRDTKWYDEVKRVVTEQDASLIPVRYHMERDSAGRLQRAGVAEFQPSAWRILRDREGYEYEGVELVTVEQP